MDGEEKSCIFWLSGLAGTGKSAIARTIARQYNGEERLAASFFFSRGGGDSRNASFFVTSIAHQLAACEALNVGTFIRDAVRKQNRIASQALQDQWTGLVMQTLRKYKGDAGATTFLIVVDALDECEDQRSIGILLQLLPMVGALANMRLRIVITSRLEPPVRYGFRDMAPAAHRDFKLHHIARAVTNKDIEAFLKHRLARIATNFYLNKEWPGLKTLLRMVEYAQGLFIWAETACRFLAHDGSLVEERLEYLMNCKDSNSDGPESHLDKIYTDILLASIPKGCSIYERNMACDRLRTIFGAIIVLSSAISATALGALLAVPPEKILRTISKLHSILDVPDDDTQPLRLHHDSLRSFLVDANRCKEQDLLIDVVHAHAGLAEGCIKVMSSTLTENMCNQEKLGMLASDLTETSIRSCIPPQTQYACLYWVSHIEKSQQRLTDWDRVHKFLQHHILHWIEVMGWMRRSTEAIEALTSLEAMTKVSAQPY